MRDRDGLGDILIVIVSISNIIVEISFLIFGTLIKMIWYNIDSYSYLNNLKIIKSFKISFLWLIQVKIVFLFTLYQKPININKN